MLLSPKQSKIAMCGAAAAATRAQRANVIHRPSHRHRRAAVMIWARTNRFFHNFIMLLYLLFCV